MQHSIEDWIKRIDTMKDLCIQVHRERNRYAAISGQDYDYAACKHLLEQVQSIALLLAKESVTEIKTEMNEWKK